jgi:hypothetical protein
MLELGESIKPDESPAQPAGHQQGSQGSNLAAAAAAAAAAGEAASGQFQVLSAAIAALPSLRHLIVRGADPITTASGSRLARGVAFTVDAGTLAAGVNAGQLTHLKVSGWTEADYALIAQGREH